MSEEMTGVHELKTWPEAFDAVASGDKTFEWRKADRNFQEGDVVVLREWDPTTSDYTGREIVADVGFVLRAPAFGVPEGFCVFSLIEPSLPRCRRPAQSAGVRVMTQGQRTEPARERPAKIHVRRPDKAIVSPTKTSADASRKLRAVMRERALSFLNSDDDGEDVPTLVRMLTDAWDEGFETAFAVDDRRERAQEEPYCDVCGRSGASVCGEDAEVDRMSWCGAKPAGATCPACARCA